jgi:hypothetical protein
MAELVYFLGAAVTAVCSLLLLRGYARVRQRLLLWSGLCFAGLTASNVLLVIDLVFLPTEINLYVWRLATAAVAMLVLLYGLITESTR